MSHNICERVIFLKAVIYANHKTDVRDGGCTVTPLAEIFGKSLAEYSYDLVKTFADEVIVVCTAETKNCIKQENNVIYCNEEDFSRHINKFLNDTTVFIDGGAFYNIDISKFIAFHKKEGKKISMAASVSREPFLLPVNSEEDRHPENMVNSEWRFNNLYILEKEMLGINVKRYIESNGKNEVSVYHTKESFVFVSSVWDLMKISFDMINKTKIPVHKSTFIDESAIISEKSYIGKNCKIGKFVKIGAYTVIEDNCIIKDGASLKYSSVCKNSYIGRNSEIEFSYVMENTAIGDRCILQGGNVVEKDFVLCNDSVAEKNTLLKENVSQQKNQNKKAKKITVKY